LTVKALNSLFSIGLVILWVRELIVSLKKSVDIGLNFKTVGKNGQEICLIVIGVR
jgi:hypothetical protein